MSRPAPPPRTVLGREAMPEAQLAEPKLRRHAASMIVLLAILVLLLVVVEYLTRAGYLMPVPPIIL